ncbi:hypothetical protein SDC9_48189 [bioreactor metagenome]|uniref:Uncharacterized protein n=1 Tax=bioreactor metagenome TaxID=1076179 RepID=A0A644WED4_9ZZZZ
MGDVDEGRVGFPVQALELRAHLHAQLCIEIGQRFIHEQYLRPGCQRPGDGNALLLASAELGGIAAGKFADLEHGKQLFHPCLDCFLGPFQILQSECDVLVNGHVRPQRIVLEQKSHVAFVRWDIDAVLTGKHHLVVDGDDPFGGRLKTGDHPEGGGLAAP